MSPSAGPSHEPFCLDVILFWADAHYARTGRWPTSESGKIPGTSETWGGVDAALRVGVRGLPGGSSLPELLAEHRDVPYTPRRSSRFPLSEELILAWADAHHARTGAWPNQHAGPVDGTDGLVWKSIDSALRRGQHGLPGGDSLSLLLARRRGHPHPGLAPPLTTEQILAWADAHFARTGSWPGKNSGPVVGADGETWAQLDDALRRGNRGLPGGSSLAQLLGQARRRRNRARLAPLTEEKILAWADEHYNRHGQWPTKESGPIPGTNGEVWMNVDAALRQGLRSLPSGSSLARLLARQRGRRNHLARPPLTEVLILAWADAHFLRTGSWPHRNSGPIPETGEESWQAVSVALAQGHRGLPKGSSLARLLAGRADPGGGRG